MSNGPSSNEPTAKGPFNFKGQEALCAPETEKYKQMIRAALLPYALHLTRHLNPPQRLLHPDDFLTLLKLCRKAYAENEMFQKLKLVVLPLIIDKLIPGVERNQKGWATSTLAGLSDHPLWHQEMVRHGFSDDVSAPNQFHSYAGFIEALRAIDEGRWSFDCQQIHELYSQNQNFTPKLQEEPADKQVDERIRGFLRWNDFSC